MIDTSATHNILVNFFSLTKFRRFLVGLDARNTARIQSRNHRATLIFVNPYRRNNSLPSGQRLQPPPYIYPKLLRNLFNSF